MSCVAPFTNFEISTRGDVLCCCSDWLPIKIGNLLYSKALDIWNGPVMRELRQSVLDGSYRFCRSCPFLPRLEDADFQPTPPMEMDRIPKVLLCYDYACNLACPACRTESFQDESAASGSDAEAERVHEAVLASRVLEIADTVLMTGTGDPFASPRCRKLIRDLPVLAPRARLSLLTNGLLCDEAHWRDLGITPERLHEVGISVDAGSAETYAKNRGGSWDRLWSNIDFVASVRPSTQFGLYLNYVVQANNFRELPIFLDMADKRDVDNVNVYCLRNIGTFSEGDYASRAVHLPQHPEYDDFAKMMLGLTASCNKKLKSHWLNLPIFPARQIS
jgi:hypothetical protein